MTVDVVVAGYLCIDLTPQFHGAPRPLQELFRPGALIDIEGMPVSLGGAVANAGIALRKFGCEVATMGLTGNDLMGDMVDSLLKSHGITGVRRSPGAKTSFSVVLSPPETDRIFLECCGANDLFSSADIDYAKAGAARIFHLGYPPLMRNLWRDGGDDLASMLARVRDGGAVTSLDMAMVDPQSPAGRIDWRALLEKVLPQVDLFVPSVEELTFMLQPRRHAEILATLGARDFVEAASQELVDELSEWVLQRGVSVCCIKSGRHGLHLRTADVCRLNRAGRLTLDSDNWGERHIAVPALALTMPMVTALGAGDAAVAGFLAALVRGETIERTALLASIAGRDSLYGVDPVGSLRNWETMVLETDCLDKLAPS